MRHSFKGLEGVGRGWKGVEGGGRGWKEGNDSPQAPSPEM